MEDEHSVVHDLGVSELPAGLGPPRWFGVYDGHGGSKVSAFLKEHLHRAVATALKACARQLEDLAQEPRDALVQEALATAFHKVDRTLLKATWCNAGSTATCALLLGSRLYCANTGDSRTVLCRGGQAVDLSSDHKPKRADERARIEAAGGLVKGGRVMGDLAVSRAFGDKPYKNGVSAYAGKEVPPDAESEAPLVVVDPEVKATSVEGELDGFLLLACDGLWDKFTSQEACDFVRHQLSEHGDPNRACAALSSAAIDERRSFDNVTIVLVVPP